MGLSTRLGAALRHAGRVIGGTVSARKLVIVLTDGEPSDIDVSDPLVLVEDARRAAVGLHAAGIDAYGVVLGQAGASAASRIFGRHCGRDASKTLERVRVGLNQRRALDS